MTTPETRAVSGVVVAPTPRRRPLRTLEAVRVEMQRLYYAGRDGTRDIAEVTKLVFVLTQIGRTIEAGDIERRLEALESRLEAST